MSTRAHAVLSPSAASRWLSCTPSARLETTFPETRSEAADEGTLAHTLGEIILSRNLLLTDGKEYIAAVEEVENNPLYDASMFDHANAYAVFVMERYSEAQSHTKDALIFLEQKLNLTDYVPEGFGTVDAVIIADNVLDLVDLKYGKGVMVSAHENKQMMLYALGALREFDFMYDIQTVRMTIFQPRIDNYSTYEIAVSELRQWAENELKPRAALAFEGQGDYAPGDHCRFCKAKAVCKANAEYQTHLAVYDFQNPDLLSEIEVADILKRADAFSNWLSSVEDYALQQAINGRKWPGYKLVEGRSNRQYANEESVSVKLTGVGYAEDVIYTKELLGITAMEKALGKKDFNIHLNDLIVKPQGKPALVPVEDKRPEFNSTESAAKDFATTA